MKALPVLPLCGEQQRFVNFSGGALTGSRVLFGALRCVEIVATLGCVELGYVALEFISGEPVGAAAVSGAAVGIGCMGIVLTCAATAAFKPNSLLANRFTSILSETEAAIEPVRDHIGQERCVDAILLAPQIG